MIKVSGPLPAAEWSLRWLPPPCWLGARSLPMGETKAQHVDLPGVTEPIEHDVAPAGGEASAMPRPIPLVDPVIMAVFPSSIRDPRFRLMRYD